MKPRTMSALRHLWRLPMLVMFGGVLAAGLYALTTSFRHIAVGALNPRRNAFVTYIYENEDDFPLLKMQVRDSVSGDVISALPVTPGRYRYDARWSPDGSRLVSLVETPESVQQILEIQIAPPKILRQETITGPKLQAVFWNPRGRLIHVENYVDADPRYLRMFEENGAELATIEYGRGEEVHARSSNDGDILSVVVYPDAQASGDDECLLTDGSLSAQLQFDTATGKQVSEVTATDFRVVQQSPMHLGIPNQQTGMFDIVVIGKESEPVISIGPRVGAVLLDEGRFATWRWKGKAVTVFSPKSNDKREHETAELDQVAPAGDGNALIVSQQGRLTKLDLSSGQSRQLLNVRPWLDLSRAVAAIGIPAFVVLWLWLAVRAGHGNPMMEVILALLISIVVLMTWSRASSYMSPERSLLRMMIYTSLGAVLPILLVWVSAFDSFWGKTVPLGILSVALLVAVIRAWANKYELIELVLAGGLLIFWQVLGIALFRNRCGRWMRAQADVSMRTDSNQLTLMQMIVTTATLAVLFTCLRIGGWSRVTVSSLQVIWLITYTLLYSSAVFVSLWAAFRVNNLWLGIAMLLAFSTPLLVIHCGAALHFRLYLGGRTVEWYGQVLFASLMTFALWRYCRNQGYGLVMAPKRECTFCSESSAIHQKPG